MGAAGGAVLGGITGAAAHWLSKAPGAVKPTKIGSESEEVFDEFIDPYSNKVSGGSIPKIADNAAARGFALKNDLGFVAEFDQPFVVSASRKSSLFNTWHKGTFPSITKSINYHLAKHGKGRTASQYTRDAMNFYRQNKHLGNNLMLKDGTQGLRIQTKQIINGKTNRIGGFWTKSGRLVTFWD